MNRPSFSGLVSLVSLLALATASVAQAPLLGVSVPTPVVRQLPSGRTSHTWKVLLTNNYSSPVTAYAITFQSGARPGGRYDDSIPGTEGLQPSLPPGATASVIVPGSGTTPPVVESVGVIYADGATAGQPDVINHFLTARAILVSELPQTIARLQAISADPGADRASVVAHFQQQEAAEKNLLADGSKAHVPPRIAGSVLATMSNSPQQSMQASAAALAQSFSRWLNQLEQSKPKLQTISFPAVP